jgi:predicted HTH domain antitoxin
MSWWPAYSQTGCSGLAPAPELCDSGCRNLALRAFVNKPHPSTLKTYKGKSRAELEQRSKFLLALKYFELGEITSGQAAQMAGMGRVAFLNEASRSGVAVIDMDEEEMEREFAHV